jgi:large subunit ribosomal protein L15
MKLHDLKPMPGSNKSRKRVGRGMSSGHGKTAGRGVRGQNSRAGGSKGPYFEGGQLPLVRRLPFKRGFVNPFRIEYSPVNIEGLNAFDAGTEVTPEVLVAAGLLKTERQPVVILGNGELDRPLTVKAHRFSKTARSKIEAAGGTVEELLLVA